MKLQKKLIAGIILAGLLGSSAATFAASGGLDSVFTNLGVTKTEVKQLVEKQKNGETLTADETSLLDQIKSQIQNFGSGKGPRGGHDRFEDGEFPDDGMRGPMGGPMMDDLTDEEKTALESMTDEEKQAFFDAKRDEMEAQREQRETVIDKKLNDETLTDDEKVVLEEIKTQRAEMKAKREEQKAAFEAIKPIMEKKRNGETLTDDERAQLDAFEAQFPHPGKGHEKGKGFGGMKGHFDR